MAELLDQARQLLAAGPYDARPGQVAAVHAAIYPDREAVCLTCRHELGRAYFAIKRWAEAQPDFSTSTSTTVKKSTATARFKSDAIIYTPHGLGVAYSNDNLTDKAARYILKNDPDAEALFSELPPEAEDETAQPAQPAPAPAAPAPAGPEIDYVKLAQAIVDLQNKNKAQEPDQEVKDLTQEAKENGQPLPSATSTMTASTGGAANVGDQPNAPGNAGSDNAGADDEHDGEKPVRLSRMNKELLVATYTAELGQAPAEGLTNDELRDAIAEHRAGLQDPE